MKCPSCGAEIGTSKFCEFCGSQITVEMQKDLEQLNKAGCPKCGSSNIAFRRENQGETRGKKSKKIVHKTVGYCKDCGFTWYPNSDEKKRKTWLWVLGWIFIFPLPLTLILLKKKDMKPAVKKGIIVAAWAPLALSFIFSLLIGIIGMFGKTEDAQPQPVTPAESVYATATDEALVALNGADLTESEPEKETSFVLSWNQEGKFGKKMTLNAGTDMEMTFISFYVPAGTYQVKNHSTSGSAQVSVFSGVENDGQWDQFLANDCDDPVVVIANGPVETLEVKEGQFIKLSDNSENIEFVLD